MSRRLVILAFLAGIPAQEALAQQPVTPSPGPAAAPKAPGNPPAAPAKPATTKPATPRKATGSKPAAAPRAAPGASSTTGTAPAATGAAPAAVRSAPPVPGAEPAVPAAPTSASAAAPVARDGAASADSAGRAELERLRGTTQALIRMLVEQGVLTREKADELLRAAEQAGTAAVPAAVPAAASAEAAATPDAAAAAETVAPAAGTTRRSRRAAGAQTVRVPYVPETVKNEIRDQVREEVLAQAKAERWGDPGAMPAWVDKISFSGDIRFRVEQNYFSENNTPALQYNAVSGSELPNTTNDETKFATRVRFGANAKISDGLTGRVSFATGNGTTPVSLNQNFANTFSGYSTVIDQVFLRYNPTPKFSSWIGRMPRPFVSTDLMFWEDLNMDGVATTLRTDAPDKPSAFITGGAFLVQRASSTPTTPNPKTKSLLAVQAGGGFDVATSTRLNGAIAYYDYQNIEGIPNPTLGSREFDWTAPQFRQVGNSLFNIDNDGNPATNTFALASKFKIVDVNASLDLAQFDPNVLRFTANYARNLGFDRNEILSRTGRDIEPKVSGYLASLLFGRSVIKERHDWHVYLTYRRVERDAVVDAFTDDVFNLGGTNSKGYQLGLRYGLADNTWMRLRWTSADQVDSPGLVGPARPARFSADVLQVDLNARF